MNAACETIVSGTRFSAMRVCAYRRTFEDCRDDNLNILSAASRVQIMAERESMKRLRARFTQLEDKLARTQARFRHFNRRGFILDYDRFLSGLKGFSRHGRKLHKHGSDNDNKSRTMPNERVSR